MTAGLPFDAALVRERRLALGLSQRVLARTIGVGASTLGSIEAGSPQIQHLSLAQAHRLADALSVDMSALFRSADAPQAAVAAAPDAAQLGEVLHAARYRNVDVTDARLALGWDRARMQAAEDSLRVSLAGTGLRLRRGPGYISLLADGNATAAVDLYTQAEAARVGIRRAEAKLIRDTLLGRVSRANLTGFTAQSGTPTKAQGLAKLIRSGLLLHEHGRPGGIVLSADLRHCLALDE